MAATENCEKKWLASRRKRNRDLRDFIPVHGKILKPSLTSLPAYRGERGGKRKQQVPLAKLQEEKRRNDKVPATAFSTGVRRKAPRSEVNDNNSSNSVDFSSTATWEDNWHSPVHREQSNQKPSERVRGNENRVTSSPRKKTVRKNALSLSSKTSPAVNPGFSPSILGTVPSTPSVFESPATRTTPSPSLLTTVPHTPVLSYTSPSMDPQPPSPSLLASTLHVLHSDKSPAIDPSLSPSLLRGKHTVPCSPPPSSFPPITTETPPITIGKTSPGELFSSSYDEKSSENEENEEFDCSLLSLSPETRDLIAELEECERLCDRLLALT